MSWATFGVNSFSIRSRQSSVFAHGRAHAAPVASVRVSAWSNQSRSFWILLKNGLRNLLGDLDDGRVVLVLICLEEARAHRLETEELEPSLWGLAVFVELAQQNARAPHLHVGRLVGIGHVPAARSLGTQGRMVLREAAQLLEVGGKPGVDLAWNLAGTTVVQEVLVQHLGQLRQLLVLLPARDLADELRVNVLEALGLAAQLPFEPLDGGGFVDDEDLELHHVLGRKALSVVFGDLFEEENHAVAFGEAAGETGQELAEIDRGTVTLRRT